MTTMSITADQIANVIPGFYKSGVTPIFVGKPGIGKTAFVHEGAAELSAEFNETVVVRELHLASMSETDVRGYLIPVTETAAPTPGAPPLPFGVQPQTTTRAVFTKPEFWAEVERHPRGILFLDEFPQAPHEVQKAVATLLLERRIGEYQLPPGWSVMLAGNGIDDNSGANTILAHIMNRVCRINVRSPDVEVWTSWATATGLPFELIAFAKLRPTLVFDTDVPDEPDAPWCTARSLTRLGAIANATEGGLRQMVANPVGQAIIAGMIGQGAAAEMSAVVQMAINLPSYEEVIAAPERTAIPDAPDKMYALMVMVATRARIEDAQAVLTFLTRYQVNYAMAGIVALIRKNPVFAQNPVMSAWIMANNAVIGKFNKWIVGALKPRN